MVWTQVAEHLAGRPTAELQRFLRAALLVGVQNTRDAAGDQETTTFADLEAMEGRFKHVVEWLNFLVCGGDPKERINRSSCVGVCGK